MSDSPKIGIAYSPHKPKNTKASELISEESVEQTAKEVRTILQEAGYSAMVLALGENISKFVEYFQTARIDVIVNLCEGFWGKAHFEANIAAFFELMNWPFTGNPSGTLALCQNKFKTKAILRAHGLPIVAGILASGDITAGKLKFPLIVKPNEEDASLGVYAESVVSGSAELNQQVERIVRQYQQSALIEEFIYGREFNVAVVEEQEPRALPVSEIDFSNMPAGSPHICSYEAKWFEDHAYYHGTVPVCPARINNTLRENLQTFAVAAFRAMGCRDYARVDFRVAPGGEIYILEVNPNPDISLNAGFARALRADGMEYTDFWRRLIERALRRKKVH
ncbi:ATP-grasp domain-containing protein [candidate division KSB1 bacterium]|nr:ATP-grasp domain-containing protein [candidate division KSB1 bacterium]